jgi:hypothetical protein
VGAVVVIPPGPVAVKKGVVIGVLMPVTPDGLVVDAGVEVVIFVVDVVTAESVKDGMGNTLVVDGLQTRI